MNDKTLAQRLRDSFVYDQRHYAADPLIEEAADRIEMLERALGAVTEQAIDTIEAQATRMEALEAALRFYARENNWKSCGVYMCGHSQPSSAEVDRGNKARKALESQP